MWVDILATLVGLALPLALGLGAGAVGLFPSAEAAMDVLNRYVLYLAFPVLIVVGMVDRDLRLPQGVGFYATVPIVAGLFVLLLMLLRHTRFRDQAGGYALTSLFANTAYVGLPVVQGVLGRSALGLGAMAVAIHVALAMFVGTFLLLVWGGGDREGALGRAFAELLRQPLALAPVVGLLLRGLPQSSGLADLLAPIGGSAGPVALFLIGLFLHTHARALRLDLRVILGASFKLLLIPGLTIAVVSSFSSLQLMAPKEAAVLVLLSSMPTAIATFSIARELRQSVDQVAVTIVLTTLLCPVVIPLVALWLG